MDVKGNTHVCASPVLQLDSGALMNVSHPSYLIMVSGGMTGTMFQLSDKGTSLGRSADNSVQLHDGTVSRHHAKLSLDVAGVAWLTDLGSTNGTFVNRQRITPHKSVIVTDGDRIQLGSTVVFKYLRLDPCDERFQREMFERTVRDTLTGLYNRRYFLNQIHPLAELNAMRELGLAIIMVDVDHFKRINDNFGHDIGDVVLCEVATILRESTRAEDLIARYGGEEFIVALPSASRELAVGRAEKIRSNLARRRIDVFGCELQVTASLGLAFSPAGRPRDIAGLISSADHALYEAKQTGRNRVVYSTKLVNENARKTESADAIAVF